MPKKTLTISVAAYNIEKTIRQCLDSMVGTGCEKDIEILIIDDGSSDRTAEIGKDYEKRYPGTIRLISKENGGHGSTVNVGIKEAKGKFFRPVDGDDWLKTENIDSFINRLKQERSDIVLCNYESYYGGGEVRVKEYDRLEDNKKYSFDEIIKYVDWMNYHSLTYRTDLLKKNEIILDEHCFYVDTELVSFPVPYADTIAFYDMELYCYRRDDEGQSVSQTSRMKHIGDSKKVAIRLLRFLKKNESTMGPSKRRYLLGLVSGHCLWHFKSLTYFAPDEGRRKELILFERYVKRMSPDVFNLMAVESSNRVHSDVKIVRFLRKSNYKFYNIYGMYRAIKGKFKELKKR